VPLTPGTWFLSVYNANATNTVYYSVIATYSTTPPIIIALTNGINPSGTNFFTAPPGPDIATFYSYIVPTNNSTNGSIVTNLQFVLTNLSGDVDLMVGLDGLPSAQNSTGSFNPGIQDETVTLTTNSSLPSLAGTWYLAIPNNDANNVTFQILVSTNVTTSAPTALQFSSVTISNGQITLCWLSVPGQHYTVEASSDLVNWTAAFSATATSTTTCYTEPLSMNQRFYRLLSP
jgi:hypothetical protein